VSEAAAAQVDAEAVAELVKAVLVAARGSSLVSFSLMVALAQRHRSCVSCH
jgi:hypothetical protein